MGNINKILNNLNHYYSFLLVVIILFFLIFKFFLGFMVKIGRPDIAEYFSSYFQKNKLNKEKEKLEKFYTNKEMSIYELENISDNWEEAKEKKDEDQFSMRVRLSERYKNAMQCIFFLERIQNKPDLYKIVKVKVFFGNNYI